VSHRADSSFFEKKREWSKQKDHHIEYYLPPYLQKVKELGRPILLVDAFAGPGTYDDNQPGSPIIFCKAAQFARERGINVEVKCIEPDPDLFKKLQRNIAPYGFAEPIAGSCEENIDRIEKWAKSYTVFVYFDPFRPTQLRWETLQRVCSLANSMRSVEVLVNFHAPIFGRWARQYLTRPLPPLDPQVEDIDGIEDSLASVSDSLGPSDTLGGDWWRGFFDNEKPFPSQVFEFTEGFKQKLQRHIAEVCYADVKVAAHHSVPKYFMVFGTRNHHGLNLMNDSMVKAREIIHYSGDLETVAKMKQILYALVPHCRQGQVNIDTTIISAIRQFPARMSQTEIRSIIRDLIAEGVFVRTGKVSFNKDSICQPDSQAGALF